MKNLHNIQLHTLTQVVANRVKKANIVAENTSKTIGSLIRNISKFRTISTVKSSSTISPEISENIYLQTVSSSAYMRRMYAGSVQQTTDNKATHWRFAKLKKAFAIMLISVGLFGLVNLALSSNTTTLAPVEAQIASVQATAFDNPEEPTAQVQSDIQNVSTIITGFGLIIPSIGVEASMETVGLKSDGSLGTPRDYSSTGWYNGSPYPGETGPSVIVGHVDSKSGPAVFWKLPTLTSGSQVIIQNADGSRTTFEVERLEQYSQSNFPTESVYGDIGYSGLRLITCSGSFNRSSGRYSHNTVVYAKRI